VLLDQTVGGAVGVGSHGSSPRHGTLSDAVIGLTLVRPGGRVTRLGSHAAAAAADSGDENEEKGGGGGGGEGGVDGEDRELLLRAARLGLGRLGIVTEVGGGDSV
jgi:FAD/FMN-containing dehydrogenase